MKHIIIGTAGHVDHGKSSLIKALTGQQTDRLKEEQKRGITIELGFAWLTLPDGSKAGIVDVPGHERFVHNMLAGAGGIDLALLVVAADEGVMPQTEEHLEILRLLNIKHGIIVLTKVDLVDEEWIDLAEETVKESVAGTFFEKAKIFRVSAYTGQGIDELREEIFSLITDIPQKDEKIPFREPIDRVFSVEGFGTVITGTVIEGKVETGETVMLYPGEKEVRVRNIQVHETDVPVAYAGQRTAINLAQISKDDIDRGYVLAAKNSIDLSQILDVKISVSKKSPYSIKNRSRVHFHYGSSEAIGQVRFFDKEELEPGEEAYARLNFQEDIAVRYDDPFVLRFYSPLVTLGGGRVLDPCPQTKRVKNEEWRERLLQIDQGSERDRLYYAIDSASHNFYGIGLAFRRSGLARLSKEEQLSYLEALLADRQIYKLNEELYLSADFINKLSQSAERILEKFHQDHPFKVGMRRESLRTSLLSDVKIEYTDKILDLLEEAGKICSQGGLVASPSFELLLSDEEKGIQAQILDLYKKGGFTPPELEEVTKEFKAKSKAADLISNLIDRGELVRLDDKLNLHKEYMEEAKRIVVEMIEKDTCLKLSDFRDRLGVSRKYAAAVLEYFDKIKFTRMKGDVRVLVQ